MKSIGVSVYPDFHSQEVIKKYLNRAASLGFKKVFVSLILGNLGFENASRLDNGDFREIFSYCGELGLEVSADINDEVFKALGCTIDNLKPLKDLNIMVLRLDGGFNDEEVAELTNNKYGIKIEDNASRICFKNDPLMNLLTSRLETIKQKGNIKNLIACHNFFPRLETGLNIEDIAEVLELYKSYEVEVGAFVASQVSTKDLHKPGHGICTIEEHRYLPPEFATQELFAAGIDYVIIGDSMAGDFELKAVASVFSKDYMEIPVIFNRYIEEHVKEKLLCTTLTARYDQPDYLIRATQTRGMHVEQRYCAPRPKYTMTVDNRNSLRYMGEFQITIKDLAPSSDCNVVGFVHHYGVRLLQYLKSGKNNFRVVEYK